MKIVLENIEKLLILGIFLSLPLSDWRIFLFGVPLYFPEIILLAGYFLHIIRLSWNDIPKRTVPKEVLVAVVILFSGAVLSAFVNGMDRDALGAIKSWFLFPMLFAWLIFKSGFSEKDSWKAVSLWFFSVTSVTFIALLFPAFSTETYDGRLRSIFPSPNHFGFFLEYGVILGVGLMVFLKKNRAIFPLLILSESVVVSALLLTQSDGAIISSAAGSLALLIVATLPTKISRKILIAGLISFIFLSIFLFLSLDRDALGSGVVRDSLASRVMIWNASVELISSHPFFGVGPRNFQEAYLAIQPMFPSYLEWAVPHPHNIFLAFWLFTGFIGLFGFVALITAVFRIVMFVALSLDGAARHFPGLLSGLLIAFLVHGMVDTPYFRNDLAYIFWAIVAFSLVSANKKDAEASEKFCKP